MNAHPLSMADQQPWRQEATGASRPGFTMIEMLVAMVATILIIGFLNKIFETTAGAVSRGAGVSEVIEQSRIISSRIDRDAGNFLGRTFGGMISIDVASGTVLPSPTSSGSPPSVNLDQIAFIRWRGALEPVCPSQDSNLSNSSSAPYVRIWYGHCYKANPSTGAVTTSLGTFGCNYIMGRHALFLDPTSVNNTAATAAPGASVSNPLTGPSSPTLATGLTDVCQQKLGDVSVSNICFPSNGRLNVNTSSTGAEAWRIAQMHGILANGVCDLKVEYATAATAATSPIVWTHATASFDKTSAAATWPVLIKITYRLNDRRGLVIGSDGQPGAIFEKIIRIPTSY